MSARRTRSKAAKRAASRPLLQWQVDLPAPAEPDGVVRTRSALRLLWVGAGIALGYLLLIGQASSIMLLPDPQLEAKASIQFEEAVERQGRRGDVLDRNGEILSTSVDLFEVHADPSLIDPTHVDEMATHLAPLLRTSSAELASKLSQHERRDVLLGRELTPDQADAVRKAAGREALFLVPSPRRFYPGRTDAAALLGIVGRNGAGLAGLEQTLDRYLRGETYRYVQWRDRKGRQITPKVPSVQPGNTVVLTLDRRVQRVVEEAMDHGWAAMKPAAMHAVVIDAQTGEILALSNRPAQNPNDTTQIDLNLFKNRAAMDAFEPGSVFKPFVAAAALEEGLVTPESKIDCEGGSWAVATKVIRDDHPHGVVTLAEVIKYSSNIGSAKLAFQLGARRTIDYLEGFGFNRFTGLNLPGETRGAMRPPDSIKPIELATTAYGHGVSANTLQLASAMATLANHGSRMKPMLVKEIRDAHGEVVRRFEPEEDRRVISEKTAIQTIEMMEKVTETGGTGTRARVEGYRVAGKTGTAWKHVAGGYSSTERIGSFVGLLPADRPEVAIVVVVDSPSEGSRYGGLTAAPVFSEIGEGVMRVLAVPPDPPEKQLDIHGQPLLVKKPVEDTDDEPAVARAPSELVWSSDGALRAPDLSGLSMRGALTTLQGAGLRISVRGTGLVASQSPAPGSRLAPGDAIEVVLQ